MDVALAEIAKALRIKIRRTSKDSDGEYTEFDERFELHFIDGRVLTIDRETGGLNPHCVFLTISEQGIAYELWSQDLTKDSINTSRIFKLSY